MLVQWKDGTEQWVPLKITKDNYPVKTVEYAKSGEPDDKAAFQWWVPYTLKKCNQIISAIKSRVRKTKVKYGIKVPRNVEEDKLFDCENKNTLWQDAINL
eukprot:7996441-Ditylum_brightwellii.AAC.1